MDFFRKSLFKTSVSYAVIVSLLGLNVVEVAVAADAISKQEAFEKAKAGDYSDLKTIIGNTGANTRDGVLNSDQKVNLHGNDGDRAYNDSHSTLIGGGSDNDIKMKGTLFKMQLSSDEQSTEGKVYNTLNRLYKDPSYHTRDRDYKDKGDALTLVNPSNKEMVDEYERLAKDLESGTVCRIEVVEPEKTEVKSVTEDNRCIFADSPIYTPGSCTIERKLTLPSAASGNLVSFAKTIGSESTTHKASLNYPHDLALQKTGTFKVEKSEFVSASISFSGTLKNTHYVFINGKRVSNNGGNLIDYLVDGENKITASCNLGMLLPTNEESAPTTNFSSTNNAEFCSTNNNGVIDGVLIHGDIKWGSTGWAEGSYREGNAKNNSGSCPSGYWHVGHDHNMDRGFNNASSSSKRCFKQYDEPLCQKVDPLILEATNDPAQAEFLHWYSLLREVMLNPGVGEAHSNPFPTNRAGAKFDAREVVPFLNGASSYYEVPRRAGSSNASILRDNGAGWYPPPMGGIQPANRWRMYRNGDLTGDFSGHGWEQVKDSLGCSARSGDWGLGPCRIPSFKGILGQFEAWRNFQKLPSYAGNGHALNTSSYSFGCGHANLKIELQLTHRNAIQNIIETPAKCYSGESQMATANDGSVHYNLKGKAFQYTQNPTPPSSDTWQCTSSSPNKLHGSIVQTQATMQLIKNAVPPLFEDDMKHPSDVCYVAKAPKYGIDISNVGPCNDGTYNCWATAVSQSHGLTFEAKNLAKAPTTKFEKIAAAASPVSRAFASISGHTLQEHSKINTCEAFKNSQSCSLKEDVCVMTSSLSGACMMYERVYSCTTESKTITTPAVTKKVCKSTIPCMDDNSETCTYVDESHDDFQKTAVLLSVAQFSSEDKNCSNPADLSTCNMFNGDAGTCRSYVSVGLGDVLPDNDCCKKPEGAPGPIAYVQVIYAASKTKFVQSTYSSIATSVTSSGMWTNYIAPAGDAIASTAQAAYDAVANKFKDWFASEATAAAQQASAEAAANMAAGAAGEAASTGIMASISSSANFLMADISSLLGNVLGDWIVEDVVRDNITGEIVGKIGEEAAAQAIESGSGAASTALNSAVTEAIGNAFGTFMAIYAAYKITMLVNQILTACRDYEFERAYKVGTGSCHKIRHYWHDCTNYGFDEVCRTRTDEYCCYNSPLSRIIHEQAVLTGQVSDGNWANIYANGCPGFTMSEFSNLDFNRIDLSEWIELMIGAGKIPGASSESVKEFTDIDNLTRSIAKMKDDFDPETSDIGNAAERASELTSFNSDSLESHRSADRDLLLMGDNYATQYEFCGYVYDDNNAYDGQRGFVIYADGSKNYVGGCAKDDAGSSYQLITENCAPVQVDGNTIIPKTKYFTGKFGERVNKQVCAI